MAESKNFEMKVNISLREKCIIAISIIIILLIGLLSDEYFMYYFGMAFALGGFLPPIFLKKFGLIFLLSHGGSGTAIMMGSFYNKIWQNPILSDGFTIFHVFLIFSILMAVISFIIMFIYNLNEKAQKTNYFLALPFLFLSLSILIIGINSLILSFSI